MKHLLAISIFVILPILLSCTTPSPENTDTPLMPYAINPEYWQYHGKPVLLLGATNNDNLFQMKGLKEHLDELAAIGGNYVRNTMSYRDSGDVTPYGICENGLFDLNMWSNSYWAKFDSLLKLTEERDIIVQIEIWDRFDYSQEYWQKNPFKPENNINYSVEDSILNADYPEHPIYDKQQFFHSIPGMPMYSSKLDTIRQFQEKYIDKLLSYSFNYDHVLYCMNNETSTPPEWGNYWIDHIRKKAKEKGIEVYLTDMYGYFHEVSTCKECQELISRPNYYTFIDISQININRGQAHWDTLQLILKMRDQYAPRPANNTKVYGGGNYEFGSGSNEDGVQRFCRTIIGGCASSRHHRPPAGNGLNTKAKGSIKAIRNVEKFVSFWEISPCMNVLSNREPDEAYVAAKKGEKYVIYFTKGGDILLDLKDFKSSFKLNWISIENGEIQKEDIIIQDGDDVKIKTPTMEGWFAVLTKRD